MLPHCESKAYKNITGERKSETIGGLIVLDNGPHLPSISDHVSLDEKNYLPTSLCQSDQRALSE